MIQMVLDEASSSMEEAVAHTRREFSTVRTGRASSALVEKLPVTAYGVEMRLQELASFSTPKLGNCSSRHTTRPTYRPSRRPSWSPIWVSPRATTGGVFGSAFQS